MTYKSAYKLRDAIPVTKLERAVVDIVTKYKDEDFMDLGKLDQVHVGKRQTGFELYNESEELLDQPLIEIVTTFPLLKIKYQRYPADIPINKWPAELSDEGQGNSTDETRSIEYVAIKKLVDLPRHKFVSLVNTPGFYSEELEVESEILGMIGFSLCKDELSPLEYNLEHTSLTAGMNEIFLKNIAVAYAIINYEVLGEQSPLAFDQILNTDPSMGIVNKYMQKFGKRSSTKILKQWEKIFEDKLDPLEFLKIFLIGSIQYTNHIRKQLKDYKPPEEK